ncbi:MAG: hypothetical protein ABIJ95_05935 [Pseudomonadota bacterium]
MTIASYTPEDLVSVRQAKLAWAMGSMVVRATVGDRTLEYNQTNISHLSAMEQAILAYLAAQAGTTTSGAIRVTCRKGC